jgi:hypothetical protein
MTRRDRLRKLLKACTEDAVSDLLYYRRKDDEEINHEDVQEMFSKEWITNEELVRWFAEALERVNATPNDDAK